ncbi:MAG: bifunctional UDP-N-acetylglucosamine diphosphorylase/glucosamine-1-phosphate N-acetyltransferase GlmU [Deltaproteobacteria bacterium]|nr:bifunctional UDP-N-acetylglucosamine diphosphorylase/glucosamine-1-phosphate N-acetyltransferase GlmU [Deltaproteobacteria bacterium]MBN2671576.1 bifunctional UDP-N-acetylglucosamine diphosphorylase/glucosamine-1-phosphate N-acetyltransferase GlmU [Deltaproteobacteria bacterium]
MTQIASIILAAGKGTRMKSNIAKVLHPVCGAPLIHFPLQLSFQLKSKTTVVVVGHEKDAVEQTVRALAGSRSVAFAHQKEQLGTGHAVMTGMAELKDFSGPVLILSGDVPLLTKSTLTRLQKAYAKCGGPVAMTAFTTPAPGTYGRVITEKGKPSAIREFKDCTAEEKRIELVNAGIYLIDAAFIRRAVPKLKTNNAQGEFYLTDLVALAAQKSSVALVTADEKEVCGANDRLDLLNIERTLQMDIHHKLMKSGVTIQSPETVHIDIDCKVGTDTVVGTGAHILQGSKIGSGCTIEPGAIIRNSIIKDGAMVKAYSVLDNAIMDSGATVGPMGRLRPGAHLKQNAHVGNWVELKNVVLGEGSKANHLAYLGDGKIGRGVNIGAGCIFCNYDGFLKHQTIIEDDVFVGSDSQMVAPVTIGKGAYVATGTTVTANVPADALAISRGRQLNKSGLAKRIKSRLKAKKEAQTKAKK